MGVKLRWWKVPLILSTSHTVQHLFNRLIPPLIPVIAPVLDLPLWMSGIFISVYMFGMGFFQAPFGILSDRYDRRYLLSGGCIIMGSGYILFGGSVLFDSILSPLTVGEYTAPGIYLVMCAGMFFSGIGASVTHPVGYPLITMNVSSENKGMALGMWGSFSKIGDAAAPLLVAALLLVLAWNEVIFVIGILGISYGVLIYFILGSDVFDTLPAGHSSNQDDKDDNKDGNRINISNLDNRLFIYPMIVILAFFVTRMIATKGVDTFVPTYITEIYGFSYVLFGYEIRPNSVSNFFFSALFIIAAITQLITGRITDYYDHRFVLLVFLSISTISLSGLTLFTYPPIILFLLLLLVGAGLWGLNPARDALISEISPEEYEGRTFGYLWTSAELLGAAAPAIIGYVADIVGIQQSFGILAIATFLSGLSIGSLYSDRIYIKIDESELLTNFDT